MKLRDGDLRSILDLALVAALLALLLMLAMMLILAPEAEALDDNSAVPVLLLSLTHCWAKLRCERRRRAGVRARCPDLAPAWL